MWYRGGLSLLFGIEISFLVSRLCNFVAQHLDRLLPGINLYVLFGASTSCKLEVREDLDTEKKIEKSRYLTKDISIPTKRVTQKISSKKNKERKHREGTAIVTFFLQICLGIWH